MTPRDPRPEPDPSPPAGHPLPGRPRCTVGPVLCELRVWTDEQWRQLPEDRRPAQARRVFGLGWIGAVPVEFLN